MKKLLLTTSALTALAFALTLPAFSNQNKKEARGLQAVREHQEWVQKSLTEMETIRVGMTRADLLKVFVEEGGISSRTTETFAYRECPYFKVNVQFEPVGDVHGNDSGSHGDKIVNISKPYLDWIVAD